MIRRFVAGALALTLVNVGCTSPAGSDEEMAMIIAGWPFRRYNAVM